MKSIVVILLLAITPPGVPTNSMAQESKASSEKAAETFTIRFVDSKGDNVSGVKAYWYRNGKAKRISDTVGVATIASNDGLIVAKKAGYQFSGLVLDDSAQQPFEIVMLGETEPGPTRKTLPFPIADPLKQELIESIKEEFWTRMKSNPKDPLTISQCAGILARLAPDETVEFFENNPGNNQSKMMAKQALVRALAKVDFEAAVEVADSVEDKMQRSILLNFLVTNAPENSPQLAAVETELTGSIKDIPQPAYRYAAWSLLAEHYLNTNRPELSQKIIDQNIEDVRKLPSGGWSGFPRSLFAAMVVSKDPELASELIKGMDKREFDRALGRLAFHCCQTNPQKALEFIDQIKPVENSIVAASHSIKICDRMAVAQTETAFQLAQSIEEKNQRAWALGLMANRLSSTKPIQAKKAISLALDVLATSSNVKDGSWLTPSSTTAGLLPIVEKVAPEKLNSAIWESVYLAIPRSRWNLGGGPKSAKIQNAAAAIARYDRQIAMSLVGQNEIELGNDVSRAAMNQVVLDPTKLLAFFERLDKQGNRDALSSRTAATEMLLGSEREFWNRVSKPTYLEWGSDKYEEH